MPDEYTPYDPLARKNLVASVGEALLERDPVPLGAVPTFVGAGVYAIYYTGGFQPYARIVEANAGGQWHAPIYVGKAIPPGGRKGGLDLNAPPGPYLVRRLEEHAGTIRAAATTLDLADFHCRFLVVDDIWIPFGENLMISRFMPVWNRIIDGFGNHDPGGGRYGQLRSRWDVLHPGRAWALKCQPRQETPEAIAQEVEDYLRSRPVGRDPKLFR